MSNSIEKSDKVIKEIGSKWLILKKIIDKLPKKSIGFFRDEDGWQLEIRATYL